MSRVAVTRRRPRVCKRPSHAARFAEAQSASITAHTDEMGVMISPTPPSYRHPAPGPATPMSNRILLVSPASPFSPQSGAQQRTALLHAALQQFGDVDVLLLEPTAGPSRVVAPAPGILAHGLWQQRPLGIGKFAPDTALNRALRENGLDTAAYRVIVSRYLNPLSKLVVPQGVETVVDLDDWGYHYGGRGLALGPRLKSRYAAWLGRRQLGRFDAFFFVSPRDQAQHPELRSAVLPNIPYTPPAEPFPQAASTTLLFVGALWYGPNRDGIDRFLDRIWPAVKTAEPEARLLLAGAAPPAARQVWERHPDVSAPGYVDDLNAVYRDAAFTVAPIYAGGGTNIKVVESLAYGRACVTTPHCANAFAGDLIDGLDVASDDDAFARHCVRLLGDARLRQAKIDQSRDALAKIYSREAFMRQAAGLLETGMRS